MRDRVASEPSTGSGMDALLLRSLQSYVLGTFGSAKWQELCTIADQPSLTFEPMLRYDPGTADRFAEMVSQVLGRPVEAIWEDVGTYADPPAAHEQALRMGINLFTYAATSRVTP